ncbi:7-deoxyloganetic acid glucosyltransferase-like [Phalaenopsis equestris]|uniref:7-deoxyloganetic acid glucosyltransferase-like n=1 Tax=Phalaenopsis equestris TaxID=78828 RepID=UPI0009E28E63|nr:7-deoxyloganetic acid glucosyltransferase-like [Phalaenopsis equestris]
MDELVQNVLGMETILRRRDLPSFCVKARTADDPVLQLVTRSAADVSKAQGLLFNTTESLEGPTLSLITCNVHKNTYAVGPLHALLPFFTPESHSANLWEQDHASMSWLDAQPRRPLINELKEQMMKAIKGAQNTKRAQMRRLTTFLLLHRMITLNDEGSHEADQDIYNFDSVGLRHYTVTNTIIRMHHNSYHRKMPFPDKFLKPSLQNV